jgi:hypothetical protein
MTFFSPSAAMDYIRQKLRDFTAQKSFLLDQQQRLRAALIRAEKAGKSVAPILALQGEVQTSLNRHGYLETALAPIAKWLDVPTGQLGVAIPLLLAGVAIPVAGLLYLHFQKVRTHQQALDMIEKGLLTPEQAATLAAKPLFELGTFGVTPLLLVAVVGGIFLLTRR